MSGEDNQREGLVGTPERIARMFQEIFRGYESEQKPKITTFENGKDGIIYDNMVVDEGEHLCKTMRGAKKKGVMKSSYLTGLFKTDAQLRNEFLSLIHR